MTFVVYEIETGHSTEDMRFSSRDDAEQAVTDLEDDTQRAHTIRVEE